MKALLIGIVCIITSGSLSAQERLDFDKYREFWDLIEAHYLDSFDRKTMIEAAIRASLQELDPHSVYYNQQELKAVNDRLKGNFEGIGIQYYLLNDTVLVTYVIDSGPSQKAGIKSGDRIIAVDGETIAGIGISNSEVRKKTTGKSGSKVRLSIERQGEEQFLDYVITRDKIPINSIDAAFWLNDSTAYIKVNRFSATTMKEWKKAIRKNSMEKAGSLILDLQANGGGYLNAAVELSNEFLSEGELIVYTDSKKSERKDSRATKSGKFRSANLIILVDERSASASEIVAGAVQDWDRGLVIGRRTFGKGTVQRQFNLMDGSAVRITVAQYFTPTGRSIQKPYGSEHSDYLSEVSQRLVNGEVFDSSLFVFPDSLQYQTLKNQRIIYGGGGIFPDVFVAMDSLLMNKTFLEINQQALLIKITSRYIDLNRKVLEKKYPNFQTFLQEFDDLEELRFLLRQEILTKNIDFDHAELEVLGALIDNQLLSLLARDLYGMEAAIMLMNQRNIALGNALHILSDPKQYHAIISGN